MLSPEFIDGRNVHLINKKRVVLESLNRDMPQKHREYKTEKLLPMIERAMIRISAGTYDGLCSECGEEILEKRLLVRPESELCTECAEREERDERLRAKNDSSRSEEFMELGLG